MISLTRHLPSPCPICLRLDCICKSPTISLTGRGKLVAWYAAGWLLFVAMGAVESMRKDGAAALWCYVAAGVCLLAVLWTARPSGE